MSRLKIINQLKKKNPNINQAELEKVLNIFCKSIEKALINEKTIELRGFGSFFVKKIKEKYSAKNPKTGELIYVPAKNKVRFRPSKRLKKFVND